MDRTEARAQAMRLVYEWEMGGDGGAETRLGLMDIAPDEPETDFMEKVFAGVQEKCEQLDDCIRQFARGWSIERITRVDLAILRVAIWEMLYGNVPDSVVVSEAVRLADTYSTDKASSFINGVLGSFSRRPKE